MPYKRKRRNGGFTRRVKRRVTPKSNRRKIQKLVKQIETKRSIQEWDEAIISATPHLYVPQPTLSSAGVDEKQFVGQKYFARGLKIKWNFRRVSGSFGPIVRCVVLWVNHYPASSVSFGFNDYFDRLTDNGVLNIPTINASLNTAQVKNVKILMDKKWVFGSDNAGPQAFCGSKYMKIMKQTHFDDSNFRQGRCFIFLMTNSGSVGVGSELTTTFYYTDL